MDPKRLVAEGYDRLHQVYADWSVADRRGTRRRRIDQAFEAGLTIPARALDLGCGTGRHATSYLVERGLDVVGLDISPRSIDAARAEIPGVEFMVGDMAAVAFGPASFDLVTAFYSLIHVPRAEHGPVLGRIAGWLRPGGFFVGALGAGDDPASTEQAWLGTAPMFWSSWDGETNLRLLADAGLVPVVSELETVDEDGQDVTFLWVVARKPGAGGGAAGTGRR